MSSRSRSKIRSNTRSDTSRWPEFGEGALLVLFAVAAYWPVLSCGFVWDDDDYVEHNVPLESLGGLVRIWVEPTATPQYYPLVFTTFWIERRLYALDPAGYHAVNVLLHAANGLLLWRILRRLAIPAAWFAAALFVLHPVEVESVAWITERKNVLSGFFYLASALAYLRFRPLDRETTNWRWYAAALACFVLALLSKTVTCSLPAALLLVTWWKRPRLGWRDIGPLLPMFVVGAGFAAVTIWMEKHHVGAYGVYFELTPIDRILIAGRAVCFYLGKLLLPTELAFIYARWTIDPTSALQWIYPIAVVLALAAAWFFRQRIGKGPLVALLFFVGTLLPALGFIDVYPMKFSFVADHFQYLASIGPLTLLAAAGKAGLESVFAKRPGMPALIGAAWLMTLGVITWTQVPIYADRVELWSDTIRKDPESWIGHHNLAEALFDKRKLDPQNLVEARKHYAEAMRIRPEEWSSQYGMGRTYWNDVEHDPAKAQPFLEAAIRLKSDSAEARFDLGGLLQKIGKTNEAIDQYEQSVALKPKFADAHYNLGLALATQRRFAEAISRFETAVRLAPDAPWSQYGLAMTYREVGRATEAREILERLVQRHPHEPRFREELDSLTK
jgi:protein O-mannosyl-transferase